MKRCWAMLLIIGLLLLGFTWPVFAENTGFKLKVIPNLPAPLVADGRTRIPISVEIIDSEGERLAEEGKVSVTADRGGFSNSKIFKEGFDLTAGQGRLEYIAPRKPGLVTLKFTFKGVTQELKLEFSPVTTEEITWQDQQALVETVRGQVLWQAGGSQAWKPIRPKQSLGVGSILRTGEKGWLELKLPDETKLTIQPNTELLIKVLKIDPKNPNVKQSIFQIKEGKVLSKVSPYTTPGSKFEIGTDSATAGVRGTILEILCKLGSELNLSVFEGEVDFLDLLNDRVIPVHTNEMLTWAANQEFLMQEGIKSWLEREAELVQEMAGKTAGTQPKFEIPDWVKEYLQNLELDSLEVLGEKVTGFHIQPGFEVGKFELQLDFGFYKNPWNGDWQWGEPVPDVTPKLPNFVDTIAYHGKWLDLGYQEINDLSFDYGLLLSDYHSTDPYHGWKVGLNLTKSTKITLVQPYDIIYFSPFTRNPNATLQVLRLEQDVDLILKGKLGITGVLENNDALDPALYPRDAGEVDFTVKFLPLLSPFVEVAQLDEFGKGALGGVAGNFGKFFSYGVGRYRTDGSFALNYFGGRYEDLKINTLNSLEGLPDLSGTEYPAQDGYLGRLGIELWGWAKLGVLCIDDVNTGRTTGANFSGKIDRLKLEYGLSRYDQALYDGTVKQDYDWFVRGGIGVFGYEYHKYYSSDDGARDCIELSMRL